tara:strand:- start:34769 stop:35692 length:924 start_codon:yes stop_codon:yes gene_type:complete
MAKIDHPKSRLVPTLEGLHLFHFDGAPCAQRVRFVLGEKGISRGREVKFNAGSADAIRGENGRWVSRIVSLIKKQNMTQAYAEIHPDMVVPALVHDGRLYLESMDIIEYLDATFGGSPFIPTELLLREKTLAQVKLAKELHLSLRYVSFRWSLGRLAMLKPKEREKLQQLAAGGKDGENLVSFYEAYSSNGIPENIFEEHLLKLYKAFNELNTQLSDGRLFLMGDELTIADVFWAMKILRLIEVGYDFAELHPALYSWFQSIYARPAFKNEVMAKNRTLHLMWRSKAAIERTLGIGLNNALTKVIAA